MNSNDLPADYRRRLATRSILAVALFAHATLQVSSAERSRILVREGWFVKQLDSDTPDVSALALELESPGSEWLAAPMPAQVHDVLLAHGRISDPRIGRNASASAWVGEKDWAYGCRFSSPATNEAPVWLRFAGLDTLATAHLNGKSIGQFNNMYREYAVDVREHLVPAGKTNTLILVFSSPLRFVDQVKATADRSGIPASHYLRKCHSDFGSYLGARPHSVKVGIFRDVEIDVAGSAWLEDVWVRTQLTPDYRHAKFLARIETGGNPATIAWTLQGPDGSTVAKGSSNSASDGAEISAELDTPKLWWPSTHGRPELYRLNVELLDGTNRLDHRSVLVGIREIRPVLKDPVTGEPRFRFDINGQRIFLRGADLAPIEGLSHCWNQERALRLLDRMQQARMNVLRIWGEGNIPPQDFYDECDRRGILVWQDFMFGYGLHPGGDPEFDENCRLEIEQMVRSLRNHPSILLWVGGNENHMGWDFAHGTKPTAGTGVFDRIMPDVCQRLDPTRLFHPSSPYGGRVPNWPLEGDWHDYTTLTFAPLASVPTYASEVGRVSAPSLSSMRRFLSDEELWPQGFDPAIRRPGQPAWPEMWQYRSVGGSWDKVGPVEHYCDPKSAEDLIRVLGTAHGEYLRDRVERERRGTPDGSPDGNRRCWGNMVWRLNDSWPIIYWSVIDYYLEPKIPYYFLRRSYDPVLVSFERTPDRIAAWVVNDSPEPIQGELQVTRETCDGNVKGTLTTQVALEPGMSRRVLDLTDLGPISLRSEFLRARFLDREATLLLIGERYLHLPNSKLSVEFNETSVEITADKFVRQVCLELPGVTGAVFEDNFFDLPPGGKRTVRIIESAGGNRLVVRALNAPSVSVALATDAAP
jgi:hypothetical protein